MQCSLLGLQNQESGDQGLRVSNQALKQLTAQSEEEWRGGKGGVSRINDLFDGEPDTKCGPVPIISFVTFAMKIVVIPLWVFSKYCLSIYNGSAFLNLGAGNGSAFHSLGR